MSAIEDSRSRVAAGARDQCTTRPIHRLVFAALTVGVLALAGCTASSSETEPSAPEPPSAAPSEVAADDCPEPPADAPTGTVDDPFNLGDEIVIGCFAVTVDEVVPDATEDVAAANPSAAPADGNEFATVTLTITRTTGGSADASEIVPLLDGSMTTDGSPSPDLVVEPPPPAQELQEGETVTGTYVYEVSGGAALSVRFVADDREINVLPY